MNASKRKLYFRKVLYFVSKIYQIVNSKVFLLRLLIKTARIMKIDLWFLNEIIHKNIWVPFQVKRDFYEVINLILSKKQIFKNIQIPFLVQRNFFFLRKWTCEIIWISFLVHRNCYKVFFNNGFLDRKYWRDKI